MNIFVILLLSIFTVSVSALCSGLNVALLTLNLQDLKRKAKLGDHHAKRALKIRTKVHFYLSGILLANVAFASATSVILNSALSGFVAVFVSTIALVIFAEIMPQAIAVSRAVRAVSFFSKPIQVVSYLGYPITKPIELLLNKLLGGSQATLHTRQELNLLIADHLESPSELDENEVEIVQSTLKLSETRVKDVMTPLKKTFHLLESDVMDEALFKKCLSSGYSRIPVFNKPKTDATHYLLLKDLHDYEFDEEAMPIASLPKHLARSVGSMTALDTLFQMFIATKKHMMMVEKNDKIIGIITIEDLIEAVIGHEIYDETDV